VHSGNENWVVSQFEISAVLGKLSGKLRKGGIIMRTMVAFVVAPLLPAILPAWQMARAPSQKGLSAYIFVCCLIYLLQAVVGIPAFLIFSRKGNYRLWPYLLVGICASAVPAAAAVVIKKDGLLILAFAAVYMGILGALTALLFWLVARPDQKRLAKKTAEISN